MSSVISKRSILIIFCYMTIYLVWGTTYFFIGRAVETIPPSWIVATRYLIGGLFITLIPIALGHIKSLPTKSEIKTSLFLGFFLLIMGNGVVTVAEKWVDSYVTSLIISTIPLVVAIMNKFFYKGKLNIVQILGFFIGFIGVALLLYSDTPRTSGELKGLMLLFVVICCWGFATSWSKKLEHHQNTFFSTGIQMLFAGSIALVAAIIFNRDYKTIISGISEISIFSTVFLTFVGGGAMGAYNYLLKNEPTNRITSYALVNPLIATMIGLYIGKESPTKFLWFGVLFILTGLTFMLYLSRRRKKPLLDV